MCSFRICNHIGSETKRSLPNIGLNMSLGNTKTATVSESSTTFFAEIDVLEVINEYFSDETNENASSSDCEGHDIKIEQEEETDYG